MGRQNNRQAPMIMKRLYTIEEAAIYLGRTAWSVRELIWSGKLPSVRVGRRIHIDFHDLNVFIDRYKVQETPALPVEVYTTERRAEFLLGNAVDARDYARARKEVRKFGLVPDTIPHAHPKA